MLTEASDNYLAKGHAMASLQMTGASYNIILSIEYHNNITHSVIMVRIYIKMFTPKTLNASNRTRGVLYY